VAGRSSASILPKRDLRAIRFQEAVADAAAFFVFTILVLLILIMLLILGSAA
jgi:hypothetical protein